MRIYIRALNGTIDLDLRFFEPDPELVELDHEMRQPFNDDDGDELRKRLRGDD